MVTTVLSQLIEDKAFDELCGDLSARSSTLRDCQDFPFQQLDLCAKTGVFKWFSGAEWGGLGWNAADLYRAYIKLANACLTTTFVITQRQGATRRIEKSENTELASKLVPDLIRGKLFATLAVSHLTTSGRHLGKPAMLCQEVEGGFQLNGFSPWVTGAVNADWIVLGAVTENQSQIMLALDCKSAGVLCQAGPELTALSSSQTGSLKCDNVFVPHEHVLAGPADNVMQSSIGGNTGGLQTSALALGLARGAIDFIAQESIQRQHLSESCQALATQWNDAFDYLIQIAEGDQSADAERLRIDCNSLVLRATQASLTAAKGAGFLDSHPVGRWCRQAMFFLVWSCPQPVQNANLCEFAGIETNE